LVDGTSRFILLLKLSGNDINSIVNAITRQIIEFPDQLKKSLTWDREMEVAKHK
jgi:IS30 family transposase